MKLLDLFKRQKQVQDISGMHPTDIDSIYAALFAEVGEFANALKAEWAWWKRNDKRFTSNLDEAREELADIMHFWLLLGLARNDYDIDKLSKSATYRVATQVELTDDLAAMRQPVTIGEAIRWFAGEPESPYTLMDLIASTNANNPVTDVVVAYMKKTQKNLDRWKI